MVIKAVAQIQYNTHNEDPGRLTHTHTITSTDDNSKPGNLENEEVQRRRLIRKLRIQVGCFGCTYSLANSV